MHTTPGDLPLQPLFVELSVLCDLGCTRSERLGMLEKNGSGDFYNSSPKKHSGKGGLPGWHGEQVDCRTWGRPCQCQQLLHLCYH